ncbi:TonB family C-terminal domain-containing protein [Lysobacter sp. yr284]|uniref:TonB family protein n=1 Tax=Lysobacter sp. yr284 TaxID=1761791 RepID=UPI00089BFC9D|nr:TonB family protein [Lysobacter sp. yr284]SDZ25528.1 TonB family C-terminal domain-containing protein [Lysobacter sp. yr284]
MTLAELCAWLLPALARAAVAAGAATLAVMLLRKPLRAAFGAGAAYAAWSMVPAASIATLLPAAPRGYVEVLPALTVWAPLAGASDRIADTAGAGWALAWASGALATAAWLGVRQWRFQRALASARPRADGLLQAPHRAGLPAAFGLLRPRIAVPVDFDSGYSERERGLMLAHECAHIAGGDLWAGAAAAALRCLLWFQPLLHLCARSFHHDQELACDERVMRAHPGARRAYAEALFKTQLAPGPAPLSCHWGQVHPLKERIMMLTKHKPARGRRAAGAMAICALVLSGAAAAWAAQPQATLAAAGAAKAAAVTEVGYGRLAPPLWPQGSRNRGRVMLELEVAIDGRVSDLRLKRSSGYDELDQAAIAAARNWSFTPRTVGGRPVASWVRVPVDFEPDTSNPAAAGGDAPGLASDLPELDALRIGAQ